MSVEKSQIYEHSFAFLITLVFFFTFVWRGPSPAVDQKSLLMIIVLMKTKNLKVSKFGKMVFLVNSPALYNHWIIHELTRINDKNNKIALGEFK